MSDPLKLTAQTSHKVPRIVLRPARLPLALAFLPFRRPPEPPRFRRPASRARALKPKVSASKTWGTAYKKSRRVYNSQQLSPPRYPSYPNYAKQPSMPFGGSAEILELQRRFPQTNWPSSMRYF